MCVRVDWAGFVIRRVTHDNLVVPRGGCKLIVATRQEPGRIPQI